MSKRKRTCEEELDRLRKKMRKLERKMCAEDANGDQCPPVDDDENTVTPTVGPSDWLSKVADEPESVVGISEILIPPYDEHVETIPADDMPVEAQTLSQENRNNKELDTDVLEILGEDPSHTQNVGNNIRSELVYRLTHIATEGLNTESRKELIKKYPIPANCLCIGAPKLNPEIRVAIPENSIKRDKGIVSKQTQMTSAIACLGEIISNELNSKDKDKERLVKLMDLSRLLCDIQHADSVTRKNFILFSLKREEHLINTKIDSLLFGEELAEILKTAKLINKSGTELKADPPTKNLPKRSKIPLQNHLNRKAPGSAYRQPGPSQRSYEPAGRRLPPPPPLARSSRQWPRQQQHHPPPPPPPPPPAAGRHHY
ncbi:hypothetical protein evm_006541 [Chilo suppressalis]|nr:hypothetical protein evm_006541 [Chilo suppressalis]